MKSNWLTSALVLSITAVSAAPMHAAEPARPNILYILADDMGVGDVSALNPKSIWKTPALDRLAQEGMVFTDAHSASGLCTPSRYTLLTGRYSWRGRLKRGVTRGYGTSLIEPERITLPEFLRSQGYTTAMFGKWHLGLDFVKKGPNENDIDYTKPFGGGPTANGFDRFYGISASLDMPPYVWLEDDHVAAPPTAEIGDSAAPKLWRKGPIANNFKMADVLPTLVGKTVSYIRARAAAKDGRPFFLYLALTAPHTPTLPTKEFEGKTPALYGDFVLNVDHDIGQILDELDRLGLAKNTLVIFTSDNGYAPAGNIPHLQNFGHDSSAGFRGTKSDAFEGGHHEPFIARWPGVTPAGSRCDALVGQFDIYATCADLFGVNLPDNAAEDSESLLPLLRGATKPDGGRAALVSHSGEGEFAIHQGKWKLILCPGSGGWSYPTHTPTPWTQSKPDNFDGLPPYQLYDVAADPAETANLAEKHPEIVQRLGRLMKTFIERGRSTPGKDQPVVGMDHWPQVKWMKDFR